MKKILFILLLYGGTLSAQETITNLQLKAGTIKLLAAMSKSSSDTSMIKVFLAWNVEFKTNSPSDNANVTIDSARITDVAKMYETLLSLPAGLMDVSNFVNDFKTSIQRRRETEAPIWMHYVRLLKHHLPIY